MKKSPDEIWNDKAAVRAATIRHLDELDREDELRFASQVNADAKDKRLKDATLRHIATVSIIKAAKAGDDKALERLVARYPALTGFAFQQQRRSHKVGREKGEPRPTDLPFEIKLRLRLAKRDVARIRDFWKETFHRTNRTNEPTAHEIAAERWVVKVDQLINFR